jgi:phosphoglycolate phosphatase-like HAD superfamily hydrolase
MQRVYLFDIDLTLVNTGGAGSHAMNLAFEEMFGVPSALTGISLAGRTDKAILRDMLVAYGVPTDEFGHLVAAFQEMYVEKLRCTLTERRGHLLPGIPDVVEALRRDVGGAVGLATGNFRASAQVKLEHYGLWDLFLEGGFADDSESRVELVAAGIERVRRAAGLSGDGMSVYVIGDTGHDIAAARANGAIAVGVATGYEDEAALWAHGADLVFRDLGDVEAVLETFASAAVE